MIYLYIHQFASLCYTYFLDIGLKECLNSDAAYNKLNQWNP